MDIFFREAQVTGEVPCPFADGWAFGEAKKLGLPDDPEAPSRFLSREDYPELVAALAHVGIEG